MDLQSSHRPEEKGKSGLEETRMAPVKDTAMERVLPKLPGDGSGGGWWGEL